MIQAEVFEIIELKIVLFGLFDNEIRTISAEIRLKLPNLLFLMKNQKFWKTNNQICSSKMGLFHISYEQFFFAVTFCN